MRRSALVFGLSVSLLYAQGMAAAQELTVTFEPGRRTGAPGDTVFMAPPLGAQVGLIAIEPFDTGRPVKRAPYTADAVTETTQVFADGNRIEHRTSAAVARDSSGRVRREHQAIAFGALITETPVPLVTISDPDTGTHVTLDRERRVALRVKAPPPPAGASARAEFQIAVNPASAGAVGGERVLGSAVAGVAVGSGAVGRGPIDRAAVNRPGSPPPDAVDVRTEQLGEREIEGVRAEGTRTTMTVPARAMGNQLPITTVSERWYSPELQVVVLTRRADPRFGETIYRLENIVRGEPSPDLFEVPSDYRIEQPSTAPLPAFAPPAR